MTLRQMDQSQSQAQSPYQIRLSFLFGATAIMLSIYSAALFWETRTYEDALPQAVVGFVGSIVALWIALQLYPDLNRIPVVTLAYPAREPATSGFAANMRLFFRRTVRHSAVFAGLLLMIILTLINTQSIKSDLINKTSLHVQFILLIASSALVIVGLNGVNLHTAQPIVHWRMRWRVWWPIALITLLALAVRLWHLDTAMRFLVDERTFLSAANDEQRLSFYGLLQPFSSIAAFPHIYPYLQSLTIDVFGRNLFGFRAASAIIGTLTIPALYFLAKDLFDRKTALLAALLLATFPPHVQFSRVGLNNIADPLIGTVALVFLSRALQTRNRSNFVLAGIMLGFTQYFYEGGRLLLVPLTLLWLIGTLLFARVDDEYTGLPPWGAIIARFGRLRFELFLALIALAVIGIPIYLTLTGTQQPILPRLVKNELGLGAAYWRDILYSPNALGDHITQHVIPAFGMYFYWIDYTFFYSKTTSLLLSGMQIAAILGFGFVCFNWRKPGAMLVLLWVICTPLANSLMKNSVSSSRFLIVFPTLALLVAIGVRYAVALMIRHVRWQTGVIAVIGIGLALYQVNFYFNQHLPEYNYAFRFNNSAPDGYDAAWRSINFPQNTRVHLISTPVFSQIETEGMIRVWRDDINVDTIRSGRLTPNYLKKLRCGTDHAFFVQKQDVRVVQMLNRFFNLGPPQYTPFDDLTVQEGFVLYFAHYDPDDGSIFSQRCAEQPFNES